MSYWKIYPKAGDGSALEKRRAEMPLEFDPLIFRQDYYDKLSQKWQACFCVVIFRAIRNSLH